MAFTMVGITKDRVTFSFSIRLKVPATHSLQLPGGLGHATGGVREHALPLVRGAVAAGCDGVFAEVHDDPAHALSDAATQLSLAEFRTLVLQCLAIRRALEDR